MLLCCFQGVSDPTCSAKAGGLSPLRVVLCSVSTLEPGGDAEDSAPSAGDGAAGYKLPKGICQCFSAFPCLAQALYISSTVPLVVFRSVSVVLGRGTAADVLIFFHTHRLYWHLNCYSGLGKHALLMACVCKGLVRLVLSSCDRGCVLVYTV